MLCFYIFVQINLTDLTSEMDKGFTLYDYEKSFKIDINMYLCLWQSLIIQSWPCVVDRMSTSY